MLDEVRAGLSPRYAVDGAVGEGGVAKVFSATDTETGARVAIKVLNPFVSLRIARERFVREIALGAKLRHPGIMPILDSGEVADLPFYVMPFHEGGSLRDFMSAAGPADLIDAARVARDVTGALAFAHAQGIIHRDIKPENIMYAGDAAVVVDFGLAKALDAAGGDQLTQAGEVLGTPTYMSPEQALGRRELTAATDVYSLACVLFEMLAGRPPFVGAREDAVVVRRLRDPVPSIRELRPDVPRDIDTTLAHALEWNVERRLRDATPLGNAFLGAPPGDRG